MRKRLNILLCVALALAAKVPDSGEGAGVRTGALPVEAWECSQWISAADAPVREGIVDLKGHSRAADGASWFVSNPVNARKVVSARWMTTSLGVNQLYVNGQLIGREILRPGYTHYAKTKLSFTYDITSVFNTKAGAANCLAAQVTPGWWADKVITPNYNEGMYGRKCAFRGVLELTYADGSRECFGTDTGHWKAGIAGPVTHAAIFDGEDYDARILPGYATPEKLGVPELNTEFAGVILPTDGAEVYLRKDLTLRPIRIYVWEGINGESKSRFGAVNIKREYKPGKPVTLLPGETLIVDFGQNAAAVPSFTFKAKPGTVLNCLPAETVNDGEGEKRRGMDGPGGSVYRSNLRIPDEAFALNYTFGDSGKFVSYSPRCTFFGYRYVSITATDQVVFRQIESIPVSSLTAETETGMITTGDERVNRLILNALWGQRSNYLSVPTDCPQRSERLGWTGDTQVFTGTAVFFANTNAFFHKWLRDLRDSQSETGAYPGVAPWGQYGNNMMRLGWTDAGVIIPWTVWKQSGDISILEDHWDSMERFMDHVRETRYEHELLASENENYQWGDWLSYEPLESSSHSAFERGADNKWIPRPVAVEYWNLLSTCYLISDAEMMHDMALATGRDAGIYEQMASSGRECLKDKYLNPDGTFKTKVLNNMQTPALFVLRARALDGVARENMIRRLRDNFASHGNRLQTGFLGTSILMATLTENGMSDVAYELLFQTGIPGWLSAVENGATTIWERWDSYTREKGLGPKTRNSFNHYSYGCVCQWIWETCAGIASDPSAPGFKHVIMRPVPDRRLGCLDAVYKSVAGEIRSNWKYEGDEWIWNITVPEGCEASVTLPGEQDARSVGGGTFEFRKKL